MTIVLRSGGLSILRYVPSFLSSPFFWSLGRLPSSLLSGCRCEALSLPLHFPRPEIFTFYFFSPLCLFFRFSSLRTLLLHHLLPLFLSSSLNLLARLLPSHLSPITSLILPLPSTTSLNLSTLAVSPLPIVSQLCLRRSFGFFLRTVYPLT
jgi:hypothetical protein